MYIKLGLSPTYTLDAIYGSNLTYSAVAPFNTSQWVPKRSRLDFSTGAQLTVAYQLPYLCHTSVATERGLALLDFAKMPYAKNILAYDESSHYYHIINVLNQGSTSVVLKHVHPESIVPASSLWNPRALTCFLNNKKNLHYFVGISNLPSRRILSIHRLADLEICFPIVLKAPVEWSTGSGSAVSICHTQADIEATLLRFAGCEQLIIEEYLEIEKSYCVQFATLHNGKFVYLGMAEQVTSADGHFFGSWFEHPRDHPQQLVDIGKSIMQAAVSWGYRGIAGIDIALCKDDRVLVLDLNFRPNGSTAPVLMQKSMLEYFHMPVMRYTSWKGGQGFCAFEKSIRQAIGDGVFLPLSVYDPELTCSEGGQPRVSGVLAGATKDEINTHLLALSDEGLVCD